MMVLAFAIVIVAVLAFWVIIDRIVESMDSAYDEPPELGSRWQLYTWAKPVVVVQVQDVPGGYRVRVASNDGQTWEYSAEDWTAIERKFERVGADISQ